MSRNLVRNVRNQRQGAHFEAYFEMEARRADLLPIRNGQAVRYLPGGKILAVRSNLDWTLLSNGGLAAFVDTKSFAGRSFTYSQLEAHQLARGLDYMRRAFLAGFVVHLREVDVVAFYDAETIRERGPRSRFEPGDGRVLGCLRQFNPRRIWAKEAALENLLEGVCARADAEQARKAGPSNPSSSAEKPILPRLAPARPSDRKNRT